jgi:catechol 2,3-dioxygenase-like lactoylglutathione lyase family enzyme
MRGSRDGQSAGEAAGARPIADRKGGVVMLTHAPVAVVLPVKELERARRFYGEALGLEYKDSGADGSARFATGGGGVLTLLPSQGKPSETTALSFEVPDVGAAVKDLEARGVTFEDYDLPDLKTVDHVAVMGSEKAAWFYDPEGNCLCIHEVIS